MRPSASRIDSMELSVAKAISLPSGDQAGWDAPRWKWVKIRTWVPSLFATKMLVFPFRMPPKAICRPSGDHDGSTNRLDATRILLTRPVPSDSTLISEYGVGAGELEAS